jgi:hypothetical protein
MQAGVRFWQRWLVVVTIGVAAFGLSLVLFPSFARWLFGLLLFGSPRGVYELGPAAGPYITLVHGVLGAVMFGWAITMLFVVVGPFANGSRDAWLTLTVSLSAWFVTDTAFSLWVGFWPNAGLNLALAVLFAIPLVATFRNTGT